MSTEKKLLDCKHFGNHHCPHIETELMLDALGRNPEKEIISEAIEKAESLYCRKCPKYELLNIIQD